MSIAKTLSGARAQLSINGKLIGVFNSVSYGGTLDVTPVYTLGAFSAHELVICGYEVVTVSCNGFRVVGNGPHADINMPKLQDLLAYNDVTITLYDRQTSQEIMTVVGAVPISYSSDVASRGLQSLNINFQGLRVSDESGEQNEAPGATVY